MDFPPLATYYNPLQKMRGPCMIFGAFQVDDIEEDLGEREDSDVEEDEDVPAANTPSDGQDDDGGCDKDDD